MENQVLKIGKKALEAFCLKHGIRRLAVFGSQASGKADPGSDVDLLVEFLPAAMESELSGLLVDLRTPKDLSHYLREEVVRTSQVQHAR